jgi:hypothetical protein
MGRWTEWRRDRAARSQNASKAIRCPDCGTVTEGLKARRVRLGTIQGPVGVPGPVGPDSRSSQGAIHDAGQGAAATSQAGAMKFALFYRCPACKSFFSARQAGLPG